ncbi:MAG: type VI secretion system tip protein TssI/VgrG [Pseudomonadota bacterium]
MPDDVSTETVLAELSTPETPKDKTVVVFAEISEGLSKLPDMVVEFATLDEEIDFDKVLGKPCDLSIRTAGKDRRHFTGLCIEAEYLGVHERSSLYRFRLSPWLWLLQRRHDCRIFQNMTVRDIALQIFSDYDYYDSKWLTNQTFPSRTYCVQYRESDFDFLNRLFEEEGIYWFFEFKEKVQTLVLIDEIGKHRPLDNDSTAFYMPPDNATKHREDHIYQLTRRSSVQTGKVTLNDYDFEKPGSDKKQSVAKQAKHSAADHELYDYPGHYVKDGDGERYARIRAEAFAAKGLRSSGLASLRWLATGRTVKISDHPVKSHNGERLVVSTRHIMRCPLREGYESLRQAIDSLIDTALVPADMGHAVAFELMPANKPFRAPHRTLWPAIKGVQTATVVGPSGDEIHTDKYGRVKVQFHWDREGKKNEKSSCWIRTAVPWSGKLWGHVWVPRVGQEVVVDFEEGNPDRPLITGCLYNGDRMHPYKLPDNQTQMGWKTNKSKGGGGFNEFVMEDKAGEEFVRLQSERDYIEIIKNNAEITIGLEHKDKGDLKQTIHRHKTEIIKTGDDTLKVEKGNQFVTIKKNAELKVGDNQKKNIGKSRELKVGQSDKFKIGMSRQGKVGTSDKLNVGTSLEIKAGTKITLKCGTSKIEMTPTGITMKAMTIKQDATMNWSAKAKMSAKLEAMMTTKISGKMTATFESGLSTKIASKLQCSMEGKVMTGVKGLMVDVGGKALTMVKGGITMVN